MNFTVPEKIIAKRNQVAVADVVVQVKSGYHVNSTKPSDSYLIPLRFTWAEDVVKVEEVSYPEPKMEKLAFSEKPVSVLDGSIKTKTRFKVPASAPLGMTSLNGKLRYQACNDRMCLPPRTLDVKIPLDIRN
ncbi:MAG TPA: protein-disulfide reductase DsbD domain-containing protein [Bryobacteraceae bacterium]|nr:protein-disulfide reductase DsbD domain-containing protein [Bryobacteraceae bacterium]